MPCAFGHENNLNQSVCDKLTSMSTPDNNPAPETDHRHSFESAAGSEPGASTQEQEVLTQMRDIAEVPAVEVITTAAMRNVIAAPL